MPGARRSDVIAVAINHAGAEFRKLRVDLWGTRVMWGNAPMLRREAEGDGNVEFCQCIHLPIEPVERIVAEAVGP